MATSGARIYFLSHPAKNPRGMTWHGRDRLAKELNDAGLSLLDQWAASGRTIFARTRRNRVNKHERWVISLNGMNYSVRGALEKVRALLERERHTNPARKAKKLEQPGERGRIVETPYGPVIFKPVDSKGRHYRDFYARKDAGRKGWFVFGRGEEYGGTLISMVAWPQRALRQYAFPAGFRTQSEAKAVAAMLNERPTHTNPRKGSVQELIAGLKGYHRDPQWLKASNNALRALSGSPKQKKYQAEMREIEMRYKRRARAKNPFHPIVLRITKAGRALYYEAKGEKFTAVRRNAKHFKTARHAALVGRLMLLRHGKALQPYKMAVVAL